MLGVVAQYRILFGCADLLAQFVPLFLFISFGRLFNSSARLGVHLGQLEPTRTIIRVQYRTTRVGILCGFSLANGMISSICCITLGAASQTDRQPDQGEPLR